MQSVFSTVTLQDLEELARSGVGTERKNEKKEKEHVSIPQPDRGNGMCKGPEGGDIEMYLKK